MQYNSDQFVWEHKFRPHKVADCILPKTLKLIFQGFVDNGNVPNMSLVGSSGTGKTTVARAMLEELDCDYILIPASLRGNIDTLRNEMQNFASSVSFKDSRKYIILDEADYLTHAVQPALRNFIDEYSQNCGFILTANYQNKLIPAVLSRCEPIEFHVPKDESAALASQFMKRVVQIFDVEGVKEYDKATVAAIISKYFPDWRRILGVLQKLSINGSINTGSISNIREISLLELVDLIKGKNFTKVRQWAAENVSTDYAQLYREIYDMANDNFKPSYVPQLVLLVAKYMAQSAMVFDQEINFVAFCTELMIEAEWKS